MTIYKSMLFNHSDGPIHKVEVEQLQLSKLEEIKEVTMSQQIPKLDSTKAVQDNQLTMVTTLTQHQMLGVTDPNSPIQMLESDNGGKSK
jgi:hypothetical protein